MIAEVIINRTAKKLNRTFDYQIPKEMEEYIYVGKKVLVPFPPLEIQNDIVQYIQVLKEKVQSLIQQASIAHTTAKKRFETQIFK